MIELQLLGLIIIANGGPIIAADVLRARWNAPIDRGMVLPDGQLLLGPRKTWRGLVAALFFTALAAWALGWSWENGLTIGACAMTGDLFSSFIKRRLRLPPSGMALGLDQIPEALFPMLALRESLALSTTTMAVLTIAFICCELFISVVLFKLHLRNRPY